MALSGVIKTAHDSGTITLSDGTGSPITLVMRFDKGDLKFGGVVPGLREAVAITSRGKLRSLRRGQPVYPTVSFSCRVTDFSETGTGTPLDWLAKTTGTPFASRVSTSASIGDLDTTDVIFKMEGTEYGDGADHTIKLEDVHLTMDFEESEDGNTLSLSGTVYGDITNNSTTTYFASPR